MAVLGRVVVRDRAADAGRWRLRRAVAIQAEAFELRVSALEGDVFVVHRGSGDGDGFYYGKASS